MKKRLGICNYEQKLVQTKTLPCDMTFMTLLGICNYEVKLVQTKTCPNKNFTSWHDVLDTLGFSIFPDFKWSDFRSPMYIEKPRDHGFWSRWIPSERLLRKCIYLVSNSDHPNTESIWIPNILKVKLWIVLFFVWSVCNVAYNDLKWSEIQTVEIWTFWRSDIK